MVKFRYVKETHTDASSILALVKIVAASQHKRKRKKSFSGFVDNWKRTLTRLKLESARAALCKWMTRTHQTCLSKIFANSPNKQKQTHKLTRYQSREFSYKTFLHRSKATGQLTRTTKAIPIKRFVWFSHRPTDPFFLEK